MLAENFLMLSGSKRLEWRRRYNDRVKIAVKVRSFTDEEATKVRKEISAPIFKSLRTRLCERAPIELHEILGKSERAQAVCFQRSFTTSGSEIVVTYKLDFTFARATFDVVIMQTLLAKHFEDLNRLISEITQSLAPSRTM